MGFSLRIFIVFIFFFLSSHLVMAQLTANAGLTQTICPNGSAQIGSTGATGGKPPYKYAWTPSTGLNDSTISNPTANPTTTTVYTLIVTDDNLDSDTAFVTINLNNINDVSAGNDVTSCENILIILGGPKNIDNNGIGYFWSPTMGLNNPTSPHPAIRPTTSVTYILTATTPGCPPFIDSVTITIIPTPKIDAGNDITIKEGENVTLHATGGTTYFWEPKDSIKYFNTANPDVAPKDTTKYYVYASDPTNTCFGVDSVTVFVEPSDEIIIYNTFTPNGDGSNDVWFIANINKYPNSRLEVFNRQGRLVYTSRGYLNNWNGKASGEDIPAATYFYVLDLADGKHKYHGTVTIVR
ncbi:MAG TPA: gliding motility-associated C-terminal domain-containing protein [Bacteroidia bacterium]|nr:gliding motility-associated C-terminal domain-containing protein [Bacteroidia bacterium]HRG51425.1 gliding motility-associated C-terminal domain-containing protein [Bacteroidia bacterium]